MAKAYTPGLKVAASTAHQAHRVLPIPGTVRVKQGDRVEADTIVAETFMDGDITPLNVANLLSAQPGDIPQLMLKGEVNRPHFQAPSHDLHNFFQQQPLFFQCQ